MHFEAHLMHACCTLDACLNAFFMHFVLSAWHFSIRFWAWLKGVQCNAFEVRL